MGSAAPLVLGEAWKDGAQALRVSPLCGEARSGSDWGRGGLECGARRGGWRQFGGGGDLSSIFGVLAVKQGN